MQAYDLRGKRSGAGVTIPAIARMLGWQPQVVRAVETGAVGIDEATYARFEQAIDAVAAKKRCGVQAVEAVA